MNPSSALFPLLAALFAAVPCLAGDPPPVSPPQASKGSPSECKGAYKPESHSATWNIERSSWSALCDRVGGSEQALEEARKAFIEDCVQKFSPQAKAAGMQAQRLQAECGRGRPGEDYLSKLGQRGGAGGAAGAPGAKTLPESLTSTEKQMSRFGESVNGSVKSGDISALYNERALKDGGAVGASARPVTPGAMVPADKDLPIKPQQHMKSAEVPAVKPAAPATRPEQIKLLASRVVADGVSPEAAKIARQTVTQIVQNADPKVLSNLIDSGVHVYVIPKDKKMVELAPFAKLKGQKTFDGRVWDDVRGVAGVPIPNGVAIAVGEENMIPGNGKDSAGYPARFVLVHEYGHAIQDFGLPAKAEQKKAPGLASRGMSAAGAFVHGLGSWRKPDFSTAWTGAKIAFSNKGTAPSRQGADDLYHTIMKTPGKTGLGPYANANSSENFAESTAAYFGVGFSSADGKRTNTQRLDQVQPGMTQMLYVTYGPPQNLHNK